MFSSTTIFWLLPFASSCCPTSTTPGCDKHAGVADCVCSFDSYCCHTKWDDQCEVEAEAACSHECPLESESCVYVAEIRNMATKYFETDEEGVVSLQDKHSISSSDVRIVRTLPHVTFNAFFEDINPALVPRPDIRENKSLIPDMIYVTFAETCPTGARRDFWDDVVDVVVQVAERALLIVEKVAEPVVAVANIAIGMGKCIYHDNVDDWTDDKMGACICDVGYEVVTEIMEGLACGMIINALFFEAKCNAALDIETAGAGFAFCVAVGVIAYEACQEAMQLDVEYVFDAMVKWIEEKFGYESCLEDCICEEIGKLYKYV